MTAPLEFHGCAYTPLPREACDAKTIADEVLAALEIMRPKPSPHALVRIGGDQDGSYLLPDDFNEIEACFSPGVNNRKDFEDELTLKYQIKCHMCDYTSDLALFRTKMIPGMQTFRKSWLDTKKAPECVTLEQWVNELSGTSNADLILQIDIEGAEYRNIIACPNDTLSRFRIIVLEIHDLDKLLDNGIRRGILLPFLNKLDGAFVCIHAHPNNGGKNTYISEIKTHVPSVMELTFIRRDRNRNHAGSDLIAPLTPHPLDIVNAPNFDPQALDGAWLNYKPRPDSAAIKNLEDQVRYLREMNWSLKQQLCGALNSIALMLADISEQSRKNSSVAPQLAQADDGDLVEVASGRSYELSSGAPNRGKVPAKRSSNLFFHTDTTYNPSITIDLGAVCDIRKLVIYNRLDCCGDRARLLYVTLSGDASRTVPDTFFLATDPDFIGSAAPLVKRFEEGVTARYIKIGSPLLTALHFSGIEIYAEDGAKAR